MSEGKSYVIFVVALFLIAGLIGFLTMGPQGCSRRVQSWSSSAYGADWLVVHYAQDGSVINLWELKGKSVGNEENSDGINFVDNDGNVVHLSGHYVYIEIKNNMWDEAKKKFLK